MLHRKYGSVKGALVDAIKTLINMAVRLFSDGISGSLHSTWDWITQTVHTNGHMTVLSIREKKSSQLREHA